MGVVDRGLGNYAEAETMLRQAVALNGNSYDVRYNLGFMLAKLGKKQEARQQLEKAVQLKPSSSEASFQLAAVLRSLGQEEQARQELKAFEEKKQATVKEDVAGTKVNQANEYLQSGDAQHAVDLYRQAIVEDPKNARTRYDLALALDRLGNIAEEREVLQQAIQLDPSLAAAHNQLGFLSLQAGQDADAEKELKAAIALDPQNAEAQANLGVLYGQQGKNSQAEQLLRQATENNPQYAQAFVNLGLVLAAQSRFPEAEQALRSALKIGEDNPQALTVLAMVLARTGRQAEAVTYFRKVIALDPKAPGIAYKPGNHAGRSVQSGRRPRGVFGSHTSRSECRRRPLQQGPVLLDLRRDSDAKPELETATRMDPKFCRALVLTRSDRKISRQRPSFSSDAAKVGGARPQEPRYPICAGTAVAA